MRTILHSKRFFFRSNMTFSLCLWLLEHFFGLFSYVNKVVKSSWDSADQQRINFWIVIIYSGRNNNVNGSEGSYWKRVGRNNIYISRKVSQNRLNFINMLKWVHPIIFASNVFHKSHLIQKCIQNQQLLLILYTLLNQMRVVKNKDDRITSL